MVDDIRDVVRTDMFRAIVAGALLTTPALIAAAQVARETEYGDVYANQALLSTWETMWFVSTLLALAGAFAMGYVRRASSEQAGWGGWWLGCGAGVGLSIGLALIVYNTAFMSEMNMGQQLIVFLAAIVCFISGLVGALSARAAAWVTR